jgi:hypothetical protein
VPIAEVDREEEVKVKGDEEDKGKGEVNDNGREEWKGDGVRSPSSFMRKLLPCIWPCATSLHPP